MFKLRLLGGLLIGGAVLTYFGFNNWRLHLASGTQPTPTTLADLANHRGADNAHVVMSDFLVAGSYVYEQDKKGGNYKTVYLPVLPLDGEYAHGLAEWYDNGSTGPEPAVDSSQVRVLLKTTHCPDDASIGLMAERDTIQGLVVNQVESLDGETKKLLRGGFPQMDADHVVILEEGRTPPSLSLAAGMTAGGVGLFATGAVIGLASLKNR